MGGLLSAFLFVVCIPLAEGVLFALFLREIYNRNPLPLGEMIEYLDEEPNGEEDDPNGVQEQTDAVSSDQGFDTEVMTQLVQKNYPLDKSANADVFDDTAVPADLSVNEALEAMTSEKPPAATEFESLIEQAVGEIEQFQNITTLDEGEDKNEADEIESLRAELPNEKIDFTQEASSGESVSETAKELLGENFDIDTVVASSPAKENIASVFDIQESVTGTVQVTGMPAAFDYPAANEVIAPVFASQFLFTEESKPMLVRHKK